MNEGVTKKDNITRMTYCAMLITLSAVGALIKVQGTIAFDSMPGFFAALFLGPGAGALVAGIGHLLTAITSGFPLTLPMHIIVAIEMALCGYLFGVVYRKSNGIIASVVAILINGPVAALIAVPVSIVLKLPFNGWTLFNVTIIPLTIASIANVILAYLVYKALNRKIR